MTTSNIIVCMKQVLDPEMPLSLFSVDTELKKAIQPKATPPVFSPFDENALEAALRIKDRQGSNITVISLGKKPVKAVVTSALAAGADNLILLQDQMFDEFNTYLTASALAAAIRKTGDFDLVLCGLQAADTNAGQVGILVSEMLGIPCITAAHAIELLDSRVRVKKSLPDGYEIIEVPVPAVVTVTGEAGVLRKPGIEAYVVAARSPFTAWDVEDLGLTGNNRKHSEILKMDVPVHEGNCEILDGASPEEKAENLVQKLKEKIIFLTGN
ncbi:MAG: electron transfer flavoprotein subunit beta/FixA family protein [Dehalococcoidales bacterium]|nr:electron transfer flavoprotein subunit beta/FixA family protein [Dehalococcoidales bacterium]